jgi:hypothetical protein
MPRLFCFDPLSALLCGAVAFNVWLIHEGQVEKNAAKDKAFKAAETLCLQKNDCREYRLLLIKYKEGSP